MSGGTAWMPGRGGENLVGQGRLARRVSREGFTFAELWGNQFQPPEAILGRRRLDMLCEKQSAVEGN
jgi:hypothetical protein